jgi:class 3 adenylate cyclase/predicted ATPase
VRAVEEWLKSLGFGEYAERFVENDIDWMILAELTDQDLEKIGVASLGHRRRLLRAIAALNNAPEGGMAPAPPPVAPRAELRGKPADSSAERRPITVLFCDLVGSTTLASRLDAEDWRSLVNAYLDEASGAVTGLGGHVLKRLGDGLMALFGYPSAQENDAERAVRAALAIQRALGEMNARNAAKGAPELSARIGLESGPVVVEAAGEVFGDAPNIAARVQALAEPGAIVITDAVQRQTAGLFVAEDRGAHELKGVPAPVTFYRIVRASSGRRRGGARALTPLVGRSEELDLLRRRWERARRGQGQLALIVGEPGIGKSRLIEEFRARLGETPHTFGEWSSSQLLQNTPLHPIAEWGRQRFGTDAPAEQRLADLENTLQLIGLDPAEYAPLLAPLVDIPLPPGRAPNFPPEELRGRQLAAMIAWVLAGARSQAVALAFEDLQWADPTSLDLMRSLAERGAQAPLFIVATTRPDFRPPWSLRSHHTAISLSPLDRAEVAQMVGEIASRHALSTEVIEGVNERTGGVPLFVEEVTRLLLERGEQGGIQAIPPTLQQSLAARLDRLGDARETAQIGAVLGRDFVYTLLRDVAEADEPALQASLDRLAEADLLFVEGAPPKANYRFKHALIQDAAYDSLLKSRRQALHRRAAEILSGQPERAEGADTVKTSPELVAHHYAEAGMPAQAVQYWLRASERAMQRSASKEAIGHLTAGLAQLGQLPETIDRAKRELALQRLLGQASFATRGYCSPEATRAFSRARELCTAIGDDATILPVLAGVWLFQVTGGQHASAEATAREILRQAAPTEDAAALVVGNAAVGICDLHMAKLTDARLHFDDGLDIYRASDEAEGKRLAYEYGVDMGAAGCAYAAWCYWLLGHPDQASRLADEALAKGDRIKHGYSRARGLYWNSAFHALRREWPIVEERATAAIALARERGLTMIVAAGGIMQGAARAMLNPRDEALAEMRDGLAAYRATGARLQGTHHGVLLAAALAACRQYDEALSILRETTGLVQETGERYVEAEIHRLQGNILLATDGAGTPAERCYSLALEAARTQGARSLELRASTDLARMWAARGERRRAHELLAPVYGRFTEGFDTLDLKEAKRLLDELA